MKLVWVLGAIFLVGLSLSSVGVLVVRVWMAAEWTKVGRMAGARKGAGKVTTRNVLGTNSYMYK